jgi:Ser/Thr protein kinase RdoA (MazF antagonist)
VLARFHEAVQGWGLDRAPKEQDRTGLALAGLEGLAAGAVPQELTFVPGRCGAVLEALRSSMPQIRAGLGTTLIHGACRTSSLLYRGGKVAALLDMDSSRLGPVAEDLGIALASFAKCRSGEAAVGADAASALLNGYRSVRRIADAELVALPGYLAQALVYPLLKALLRVAEGRAPPAEFERGAWRLAAAEHAVARPAALVELLRGA